MPPLESGHRLPHPPGDLPPRSSQQPLQGRDAPPSLTDSIAACPRFRASRRHECRSRLRRSAGARSRECDDIQLRSARATIADRLSNPPSFETNPAILGQFRFDGRSNPRHCSREVVLRRNGCGYELRDAHRGNLGSTHHRLKCAFHLAAISGSDDRRQAGQRDSWLRGRLPDEEPEEVGRLRRRPAVPRRRIVHAMQPQHAQCPL